MDLTKDLISNFEVIVNNQQQNNYDQSNKDIWNNRMPIWFSKIKKNDEINWNILQNFRSYGLLLSETPQKSQNIFKHYLRKFIRGPGEKKHCIENFQKLLSIGYDNIFKDYDFSTVGNPEYFTQRSIKYNERWLRHVRTCELFKQHISKDKGLKLNVLDIGGGYSQFACMLKKTVSINNIATVDFMEQLFFSYYFIKKNFPNAKVNSLKEILEIDIIDEKFVQKYDFVLIPIECFKNIKSGHFNVICNFSSLGEMPREVFSDYINSSVFKKAKYLFTINRLDSWPTYKNYLTILDYELNNYDPIHNMISPLWDYYYISYTNLYIKKNIFRSRKFEFIGKLKT